MICINCFHDKTQVANSRRHKNNPAVWRRRSCPSCMTVFTTYERPSLDDQAILGRNHERTPFNIGKLVVSIARSFHHDKQVADQSSYFLAQTIETKLLVHGKSLSADDIAAITHETLKQFDPVAAIQYAAQHDLITLRRQPGRPSVAFSADQPDQ